MPRYDMEFLADGGSIPANEGAAYIDQQCRQVVTAIKPFHLVVRLWWEAAGWLFGLLHRLNYVDRVRQKARRAAYNQGIKHDLKIGKAEMAKLVLEMYDGKSNTSGLAQDSQRSTTSSRGD